MFEGRQTVKLISKWARASQASRDGLIKLWASVARCRGMVRLHEL